MKYIQLKIPPPAYMFLFAGVMWLLDKQLPLLSVLESSWNNIGWVIMALSLIPAAGAFRLFNHFKTTANPFQPEKASELVTSGIFRFTRNPMYLSLFLLLTGWAVYLGSLMVFLLPFLFILVITTQQIKYEEQALEKLFGDDYLAYKKRVRRWM